MNILLRSTFALVFTSIMIAATVMAARVQTAVARDLHEYWDRNCGNCHGHAASFARRFLTVKDGKLRAATMSTISRPSWRTTIFRAIS